MALLQRQTEGGGLTAREITPIEQRIMSRGDEQLAKRQRDEALRKKRRGQQSGIDKAKWKDKIQSSQRQIAEYDQDVAQYGTDLTNWWAEVDRRAQEAAAPQDGGGRDSGDNRYRWLIPIAPVTGIKKSRNRNKPPALRNIDPMAPMPTLTAVKPGEDIYNLSQKQAPTNFYGT